MTYLVIADAVIKRKNGIIELKKDQTVKLSEKIAQKLIETGKIKTLTPEDFEPFFLDAVHELNKYYPQGLVDHICQKYPKRWQRSIQAEERLNQLWDEGKDVGSFKKAVNEWKEIYKELIKLFKRDTIEKAVCLKCGADGERYSAGYDRNNQFQWSWWCLKCNPYH